MSSEKVENISSVQELQEALIEQFLMNLTEISKEPTESKECKLFQKAIFVVSSDNNVKLSYKNIFIISDPSDQKSNIVDKSFTSHPRFIFKNTNTFFNENGVFEHRAILELVNITKESQSIIREGVEGLIDSNDTKDVIEKPLDVAKRVENNDKSIKRTVEVVSSQFQNIKQPSSFSYSKTPKIPNDNKSDESYPDKSRKQKSYNHPLRLKDLLKPQTPNKIVDLVDEQPVKNQPSIKEKFETQVLDNKLLNERIAIIESENFNLKILFKNATNIQVSEKPSSGFGVVVPYLHKDKQKTIRRKKLKRHKKLLNYDEEMEFKEDNNFYNF